jgi:hypothetical protein
MGVEKGLGYARACCEQEAKERKRYDARNWNEDIVWHGPGSEKEAASPGS